MTVLSLEAARAKAKQEFAAREGDKNDPIDGDSDGFDPIGLRCVAMEFAIQAWPEGAWETIPLASAIEAFLLGGVLPASDEGS